MCVHKLPILLKVSNAFSNLMNNKNDLRFLLSFCSIFCGSCDAPCSVTYTALNILSDDAVKVILRVSFPLTSNYSLRSIFDAFRENYTFFLWSTYLGPVSNKETYCLA